VALREAFVPAMVRVNEQSEYARRPARMDALPAKSHPLLERLAKARLLVIRQEGDARVVEVAHEALLRKWPWLKERLDAERVFLIGKQQLEQDLRDWQAAVDKEKADALLTGLKLTRARAWLVDHPTRLTAEERAFIQASIEREEAGRRSREPWRLDEQIAAVAFSPVGDLIAVAPQSGRVRAWNLEQGLEVWQSKGPSLQNVRLISWNPTGSKLMTASGEGVNVWDVGTEHSWSNEASVDQAWWSADGREFITLGEEGALLWNAELLNGAPPNKLMHENDERPLTATFREDGIGPVTLTGTGYNTGGRAFSVYGRSASPTRLRLWRPDKIGPGTIAALPHGGELIQAAFSPGGNLVAMLWGERQEAGGHYAHLVPDNVVEVWNVQISGERFSRLVPGSAPVLMPNDIVATVSGKDVRFWDLASGDEKPIGPLHHDRPVRSVAISSDGTKAATATDQAIRVWEIGSGATSRAIAVHSLDRPEVLSFDPTGHLLRSMGYSGISIWDAISWDKKLPDAPADCHGDPILMDVGWRLVQQTCGNRAYAWVWDGSRFTGPRSRPHFGHVFNSAVSTDAHLVATASADGLEIWDPASDAPPRVFSLGAPADRITFGPDNQTIAVADSDHKRLHVIELASGKARTMIVDWSGQLRYMAFAGIAGPLITEEESFDYSFLQVRQVSDGQPSARIQLEGHGVAWTLVGDGDILLVISRNHAGLWSVHTGEALFPEPFSHPARRKGSFMDSGDIKYGLTSRDDAHLVTATDTETRVWSIAPESRETRCAAPFPPAFQ
jgi:WD40 repeat protein